jgi:hypothetical protein
MHLVLQQTKTNRMTANTSYNSTSMSCAANQLWDTVLMWFNSPKTPN